MTVRKEGKARWVYECRYCNVSAAFPDQFRAIEYEQAHERGTTHSWVMLGVVTTRAFEEFANAFKPVIDAASSLAKVFEPPKNLPHDPSLLRDRRKWGGR